MVRETGLEPASSYEHMNLNHARLPIPPFPQKLVGRGGFEPPKSVTADLQSAPFGHSGTYPSEIVKMPDALRINMINRTSWKINRGWSWRRDLNPQPADYKSAALPIELRQHMKPNQQERKMATRKGLEPSTSSVTGWHSKPTELPGHQIGGPSGTRTQDQPVMSRPL